MSKLHFRFLYQPQTCQTSLFVIIQTDETNVRTNPAVLLWSQGHTNIFTTKFGRVQWAKQFLTSSCSLNIDGYENRYEYIYSCTLSGAHKLGTNKFSYFMRVVKSVFMGLHWAIMTAFNG